MKKLIVDIKSGKQEYLDMTPAEEAIRLAEIAKAKGEAVKAEEEAQKKRDAVGRLRLSASADTKDLLEVLGL